MIPQTYIVETFQQYRALKYFQRTYQVNHSKGLEFGKTEAKGYRDDSLGHLKNAFYKLPRAFKDMLDSLIETKPKLTGYLQTVGFSHSSLDNIMLQVDRPKDDVTHATRQKTIEVCHSIENFGSVVLPSMFISLGMRQKL